MSETILKKLLKDKIIFIEEDYYVGKASDNEEVILGNVGYEDDIEKYLKAHPTPDTW